MDNDDPQKKTMDDLLAVMAALRTPKTGCPWDLDQDFSSIAPYTLEETYEVLDAIERNDMVDLREELGDLLLQVVYHAQMAQELNAFDFSDITNAIARKMIRRHPHVFGTAQERATGPQSGSWDRIKQEERKEKERLKAQLKKTGNDGKQPAPPTTSHRSDSVLNGIPLALPALVRAVKLQNKAAKVGFDWPTLQPVFEKMREELFELEEVALKVGPRTDAKTHSADKETEREPERIHEEFGDLLFVMANVARHLEIDAESALRSANQKFTRRFQAIETALHAKGSSVHDAKLLEMDALWDDAKRLEKDAG